MRQARGGASWRDRKLALLGMRRRTARLLTLVLGILLTVCGLGYCGAQFIQGGPPDPVKLVFGILMTAVGMIVTVVSARGLRRPR
jgi:CHASE2 domain-containing sensor protein